MEIKELRECVEYKDIITSWMNNEFGNEKSIHFYDSIVNHSISENQLPITFVAVEDGIVLGTAGLWRGDLLARQDLFPWFSALIVNPEYRNRGIGIELQNHVIRYCKEKGYKELYLYTDIENYYEKNSWKKYDVGYEYMGDEMTIYRHEI